MRLLVFILLVPVITVGQSSSNNYQSSDNGSFSSGEIMTGNNTDNFTVNTWYEAHEMTSTNYSGQSKMPGGFYLDSEDSLSSVVEEALSGIFNDLKIYPNPFRSYTGIYFSLSEGNHLSFEILNNNGQLVYAFGGKQYDKGAYHIEINRTERGMSSLSPGIYFLNIRVKELTINKKLVIIN